MMKSDSFWEMRKCPIVNGIIYSDGTVKLLNPKLDHGFKYFPVFSGITTIKELLATEDIGYASLIEKESIKIVEKDLTISCGEASMGGDGFVSVTHENGKLKWIAFFDYSNPFVKVDWIDSKVVAYSNIGDKWIFNIDKPEAVRVQVNI